MRSERSREWLTIHEASAMVGVSTATLRRWCDAGDVRAFTTPGGHRRFARSAVLGMLPPASRIRPTMIGLGQTAESITRAYRREACPAVTWPAAIEALAPSAREPFRECGRAIVGALAEYLDAAGTCEAGPRLATAKSAAARHGQLAATHGVTLGDTVELFLRLRAPFLHELGAVACRKGLDTTAALDLLGAATDAIDGLMPSLIAGHGAGANAPTPADPGNPVDAPLVANRAGQPAPGTGALDVPRGGLGRP
jgi:excisionase family DNA binding protein